MSALVGKERKCADTAAHAQSEGETFSLTDYNKDGRIDRQEYQRRMIF